PNAMTPATKMAAPRMRLRPMIVTPRPWQTYKRIIGNHYTDGGDLSRIECGLIKARGLKYPCRMVVP
ncbi:MAG: hypothetical protein K0Q70_1061, partial [Rhodospirillales bacterium]|nr:hypothetical protein [Rhodospirillales bacterium]